MDKLKTGIYEHYKGHKYLVLGFAKHSETLDNLVVYVCLYENEQSHQHMWVRPYEMFLETLEKDGEVIPRFKYLGSDGDYK